MQGILMTEFLVFRTKYVVYYQLASQIYHLGVSFYSFHSPMSSPNKWNTSVSKWSYYWCV